jgi:hypothetical protein
MQDSHAALAAPVITRLRRSTRLGPDNPGFVNRRTSLPPRTEKDTWWRRPAAVLALGTAALLGFAGCANQSSVSLEGKPLSGYVRMTQVQAAYLGSGNAGTGVLKYKGGTYPFSVGGLGVGGIGVSKIEARGEVYGLQRLDDFAGAYAQARYGFALGTKSAGELWLQNRKGVVMHLKAKREGLMLSLGGDAVVIEMDQ